MASRFKESRQRAQMAPCRRVVTGHRADGKSIIASDGDVTNLLQDCVNDWRGASSGAPAAASVIHTKDSTGEMSWDVTADVRAGAVGWVLRKSQGWKWGSISYYSREAARDLGNLPLAPKLVLEP